MTWKDEAKSKTAVAAQQYVSLDCRLGIGTGRSVNQLIEVLSEAPRPGVVVSSSEGSTELLREAGFDVSDLNETGGIDVYIDGADEYTDRFTLLKGGGGAHTREKILAAAASKFVVMADEGKKVDVLGKFPVAVEVLPMARSLVARKIAAMGASPTWREGYMTDEGNVVLDCAGFTITDAAATERELCSLPGVVDCGLFALRPADVILVGCKDGSVKKLER